MSDALIKLALKSNKIANLVNGVRGMNRDYRIVSEEKADEEKNAHKEKANHLRMTIVVDKQGQYVKHYWG